MTDHKQRALLSVSDKNGVVELAGTLVENGWLLLSTGGTAALLREKGFAVTEVSEHTGFPEIMGGRVKTLHPKIHGGILARRGLDDDVVRSHGIDLIDLVVVNLYPFEAAVSDPACTFTDAIENIDIGGPAMLRAAAKNHESVTVVTNPQDYPKIMAAIVDGEGIPAAMRLDLAVRAFEHTARYDGMIANYFGSRLDQSAEVAAKNFPRTFNLQLDKVGDLRYGENPHQQAAFYKDSGFTAEGSVSTSRQVQGKELSFNNIADTDAALECVSQFENPACVIVKHANPCGVAEVPSPQGIVVAYDLAFQTDPTSAFGGIIAFNREVNAETASAIVERQFVEVVIAPGFSEEALKAFSARENVRVLDCGSLNQRVKGDSRSRQQYTRVSGGLLVQDADDVLFKEGELAVVTDINPDDSQRRDLEFAWKVAKFVKSNAIVFARNGQTIGIGAGQMSRVYSTRIAAIKAADENLQVTGAVMASDAFFPFRDGLDSAAEHGISAVIQPGGSKNDAEVIKAANEHGIAMVFTGMRHFRH